MTVTSVDASRRGVMERWLAAALCLAVAVAWLVEQAAPDPQAGGQSFAPPGLPLIGALVAGLGVLPVDGSVTLRRAQRMLVWSGLLLLVWSANGLLFDLLSLAGLIGRRTASGEIVIATVWWPSLIMRSVSLAAAIVLAHIALTDPSVRAPRGTSAYAYAAFVLALPYPVLRLHWAFGGTIGLTHAGGAGEGFEPLLIAIPWVAAALLSLLLARPRQWPSRRVLLAAGWTATAIVATIGPAALWVFVRSLLDGTAAGSDGIATGSDGIAVWVFGLFYGSWFLWAIAAAAATREYQLRTAN